MTGKLESPSVVLLMGHWNYWNVILCNKSRAWGADRRTFYSPRRRHCCCGVSGKRIRCAFSSVVHMYSRGHARSIAPAASARIGAGSCCWFDNLRVHVRHLRSFHKLRPWSAVAPNRLDSERRGGGREGRGRHCDSPCNPQTDCRSSSSSSKHLETECQGAPKEVTPGAAAPTLTWKWPPPVTLLQRVDLHRRCTRTVYGRWVSVRPSLSPHWLPQLTGGLNRCSLTMMLRGWGWGFTRCSGRALQGVAAHLHIAGSTAQMFR